VDRYVVEALLGRGGMAVVYRVRHAELGTAHALKVLGVTGRDVAERLLREGRVQGRLRHPNVVAVTDGVRVGDAPGLVVELVEGPTLDTWLGSVRPTPAQVDALARGILSGVDAAHRLGLVHRDLKPGNVLLHVTRDGATPKVADFGLAKELDADGPAAVRTRAGAAMGTPAYMPPEQLVDAASVDQRADVFSLGALLLELVLATGVGTSFPAAMARIRRGDEPDLTGVSADLPPRWLAAVREALAFDPAARPPDAGALRDRFTGGAPPLPDPWPTAAVDALVALIPAPPAPTPAPVRDRSVPPSTGAEATAWLETPAAARDRRTTTPTAPPADPVPSAPASTLDPTPPPRPTPPAPSRSWLPAVAGALLVAAGLAALGAWWGGSGGGGTLVVGSRRERGTLNALGVTRNLAVLVRPLVMEPFTTVDQDGAVSPYALSRVDGADDDRTWTLVPRADRWFQPGPCTGPDGAPATADDVAYSLEVLVAAGASPLGPAGIEALDDRVVVRLEAPQPFVPQLLSSVSLLPRALAGCDEPTDQRWPVGTGPWRYPAAPGERLELVPSPRWSPIGEGARPTLDRLVFRTIADDREALDLLARGELDVAELHHPAEPPDGVALARADLGRRVSLRGLLVLRNGPHPLDDAGARRALSAAVPRDVGFEGVTDGDRLLLPRWLGYEPGTTAPPGDDEALRAHDELVLGVFESERTWGDRIAEGLAERGVRVRVATISYPALEEATTPGARASVDLALVALRGEAWGLSDPYPHLSGLVTSLRGVSYVSPAIEEALVAASVKDRTERRRGYAALERALLDEMPLVPLGFLTTAEASPLFGYRTELRGFAEGDRVLGDDPFLALGAARR
jgi:serine/threonine protein kinase/ABC-type oligopeptide transport system substrate-binding subunit